METDDRAARIALTDAGFERIDSLIAATELEDYSDYFKNALAIMDLVADEAIAGSTIRIIRSNGEELDMVVPFVKKFTPRIITPGNENEPA